MSSLKENKSCNLLEQYLSYLVVVKGRSPLTAEEYRVDLLMFIEFIVQKRNLESEELRNRNFVSVDIQFIKSISINDMYDFITHCGQIRKVMTSTRARKIISIRQFWKYLKTKAHLLLDNVAEELDSPKLPQRIPKYLTLEESIRLLIVSESSPRDYCILTIFLNCALRLSELVNLNIEQLENDSIRIIGKGNKERKIFLTPATKKAISNWMDLRKKMDTQTNALFITKNKTRVTNRGVQDIVKKYLKKAGFAGQGYSTHKLRHTSCTLMYRYGHVDVKSLKEILGHSNLNTTSLYTHVSDEQLQSAVNSNPLANMFGR